MRVFPSVVQGKAFSPEESRQWWKAFRHLQQQKTAAPPRSTDFSFMASYKSTWTRSLLTRSPLPFTFSPLCALSVPILFYDLAVVITTYKGGVPYTGAGSCDNCLQGGCAVHGCGVVEWGGRQRHFGRLYIPCPFQLYTDAQTKCLSLEMKCLCRKLLTFRRT